jgi:hypothetical protein
VIYCVPAYLSHVRRLDPVDRHRPTWEKFLALPPGEAGGLLAMGRSRAATLIKNGTAVIQGVWGTRSVQYGPTEIDVAWVLLAKTVQDGLKDSVRAYRGWLNEAKRPVYAEPGADDKAHMLRLCGFQPWPGREGVWVWQK